MFESPDVRHYVVRGSTGMMYEVCLGNVMSCTCPDYVNNFNRCKHQILCLINDFNIGIHHIVLHDTTSFIKLDDLFEPASPCLQGDDCPICFEAITSQQAYWNCKTCKNQFHKLCIDRWFSLSQISGRKSSCPMCRSEIEFYFFP